MSLPTLLPSEGANPTPHTPNFTEGFGLGLGLETSVQLREFDFVPKVYFFLRTEVGNPTQNTLYGHHTMKTTLTFLFSSSISDFLGILDIRARPRPYMANKTALQSISHNKIGHH